MTESTPVNPASRKGIVRVHVAEMVLDEIAQGTIQALIARSADFYGPNTPLSFVTVMVFENLKKGKKALWMINDTVKHSLTYTPDAGKATALLGNTDTAYGQIWHLPTDRNALTGREIIEIAAREFNVKPGHTTLPLWMVRMAGLFSGVIRESVEMLYQNESDHLFDSSKFDKAFDFKTTSYEQGVKETVRSMR